eukprot:7386324-Prymnesium_polylepis.1
MHMLLEVEAAVRADAPSLPLAMQTLHVPISRSQEAAAEAKRAALQAAEECKRMTEQLAERLEAELEDARRDEREKMD